ncbi:hypothetical protein E2C01_025488 [Portunus trituberculatus]|uniref:Secreted protein n=1 Tax=Portunus trituberculatus TaxID=210409 RepID=A0A5B7EDH5_PORTR|nr:hypothetical protein [Portunus trituberculatus]
MLAAHAHNSWLWCALIARLKGAISGSWVSLSVSRPPLTERWRRCSLAGVYNKGQCIRRGTRSGHAGHPLTMEQTSLGRQSGGGARPVKSGTGFPTSAHYQLRGGASVSPFSEDDADRGGVWSGTGRGRGPGRFTTSMRRRLSGTVLSWC